MLGSLQLVETSLSSVCFGVVCSELMMDGRFVACAIPCGGGTKTLGLFGRMGMRATASDFEFIVRR
jgi:hypothetical protein